MFFLRGRLGAKQAQSRFLDLTNYRYQWWLRTPISNLLARDDQVGFICALSLMVDDIGQGLYLLNRRKPPTPLRQIFFQRSAEGDGPDSTKLWFDTDQTNWIRPNQFTERLHTVLSLDDLTDSLVQAVCLIQDLICLFLEQDKKTKADSIFWLGGLPVVSEVERPAVSTRCARDHLHHAALRLRGAAQVATQSEVEWPAVQTDTLLEFDPSQATRLARRAVRIVWRLPGGRMTALTGSVAAGWADQTSDIDIIVYCDHLSDELVRRSLIGATSDSDLDITQRTEKRYARDVFWLDGRLIDVHYILVEDLKRLVTHPIPHSRLEKCTLAQLKDLNPLYDPTLIKINLLDRRDMQRALERVQSERVGIASTQLDQALARLSAVNDAGPTLYATAHVIVKLFDLLAARNNRWLAFPRWTANWLEGLDQAPTAIQERLLDVFATPFRLEKAGKRLKTLQTLAAKALI